MKQHNTMLTCLSKQCVFTPKRKNTLVRGSPLIPQLHTERKLQNENYNYFNTLILIRRICRNHNNVFGANQ